MKQANDPIRAALRRFVNYLVGRGGDTTGTGVIVLDALDANLNHHILELINEEQRCRFLSLTEFEQQENTQATTVLLLDSHQQLPPQIAQDLEGIFRASSFERGV